MVQSVDKFVEGILLGESLRDVASSYRDALLGDMGFEPEEAPVDLFERETVRFMNQVCRQLGHRHAGDRRAATALQDWIREVEEYDAFDTLLTHYEFDGKEAILDRARVLFPGPLTAHWN